jgi:hypothetical protein
VTEELRKVWICVGCDMRVSNHSGRPIPQPAKWEDDRCPKCRLDLAFDVGGREGENAMAELLGMRRRRPTMAKTPDESKPPKPVDPEMVALKVCVKEVSLAHPDWSAEKVGEEVGVKTRTAARYRTELGLSRQPGPTAEQREQIARVLLTETPRSDEEVAKAVGVKTFTVTDVRRKMDVPPYRTRIREDRERRVAEVAAEHPNWGYKRVATEIGVPLNSTRRAFDKLRKSGAAEPVPTAA